MWQAKSERRDHDGDPAGQSQLHRSTHILCTTARYVARADGTYLRPVTLPARMDGLTGVIE